MGGIAAARGRFVVMGDADDSYDFREVPRFVDKLREGYDLVQGCRLPSGGGRVMPGAMPFLHRWLGNPLFSSIARLWFGAPVHDVYCGLRGFRKDFQGGLAQRCTGMEFATEMVLKAALAGGRIAELPITLHPDGRRAHSPHLRTFRDGWRTLRLLLLFSPRWMFLVPGLALVVLGALGFAVALPGLRVGRITFDAHTLVFACLALMSASSPCSSTSPPRRSRSARASFRRTRACVGSSTSSSSRPACSSPPGRASSGSALLLAAVNDWRLAGFGRLDYAHTMRWVIPGATLVAIGVQTALASFLVSLLAMQRRG